MIVSSSDSTNHWEQCLREGADFILIGEAEVILLELMNAIARKQNDLLTIPGLAFKKDDAIIKTAKRNVLRDLDSLPFPAWDLIDIEPPIVKCGRKTQRLFFNEYGNHAWLSV